MLLILNRNTTLADGSTNLSGVNTNLSNGNTDTLDNFKILAK